MATVQPTDIGLATYNDVGDVSKLKTTATNLVGALNELYDSGGSSIGTQLLVEGTNNIVVGEGNIVHGNNNFILGNHNIVIGDNYNIIGQDMYRYASIDFSFDSLDTTNKTVSYTCTSTGATELPFSVGNKVAFGVNVTWYNSDATDSVYIKNKPIVDNASETNTSSTIVLRDANGRAKISNPSESYDIANKDYVDGNFVKKNADTTLAAKLTAQSNTAYTTKQVRNIVLWTSGINPPTTSYGDIVIKTF